MRIWIADNGAAFWWIMISSLLVLAVAIPLVPIIAVRIPADYFSSSERRPRSGWIRSPFLRLPVLLVKNLLGYAFIAAGLIMLVTPGQGLITLLIGSALADYPGKSRFQRWLLRRRGVIGSINWLRRRAGKEPLAT
ncbi:hypothetical protein DRJ24_03730 [Candidatus Acetothermia bacterium]|nr:MAG: hypothetical protein DRJ24_03730 [Candidatus Acetothermia bacterium]